MTSVANPRRREPKRRRILAAKPAHSKSKVLNYTALTTGLNAGGGRGSNSHYELPRPSPCSGVSRAPYALLERTLNLEETLVWQPRWCNLDRTDFGLHQGSWD